MHLILSDKALVLVRVIPSRWQSETSMAIHENLGAREVKSGLP